MLFGIQCEQSASFFRENILDLESGLVLAYNRGVGEIWAAIVVSTTLMVAGLVYLATQIQQLSSRTEAMDARLTARLDAQSARLDRVIELLAAHQHR
jgi:hypothetical protein